MKRREPAVAGTFYPGSPERLREQVEGFLADVPATGPAPKAIIGPHAGTVYSGPIAASAYGRLREARARIGRVVLLGPSHRVPLRGLGVCGAELYATPLGDIALDREGTEKLLALPQVRLADHAHAREHSLELHLPFLQVVLPRFTLLPLVVGDAAPAEIAAALALVWGGAETLVVVSTDLCHYLDYETACRLDRETAGFIEQLEWERIEDQRACGHFPLCGLLAHARALGLRVETVDLRNSGDTAGDKGQVVGYGAFLLS
ncbi:MAG: AmmeMemoRadiSam system protein B [Deltaproteobacteria bacterium]|nr:AmmeMemoRadiSam system protein B [Deltaproteobacteria bacterium]